MAEEKKLSDIFAILITEERNDLVDYLTELIKNYVECECGACSSDDESSGEEEELIINVDDDGFYSLS
jgi:hypothetical protein|tara:strand:+ start:1291 stop:1494 length:204 start_codon:yes stop_codon:yes gene_type:complete